MTHRLSDDVYHVKPFKYSNDSYIRRIETYHSRPVIDGPTTVDTLITLESPGVSPCQVVRVTNRYLPSCHESRLRSFISLTAYNFMAKLTNQSQRTSLKRLANTSHYLRTTLPCTAAPDEPKRLRLDMAK